MAADAGPTVAVAFSGGRDSLALLHATCRAAAACGAQVVALHVHHGLMPEADAWVQQAARLCQRWHRRGWPLRLRWGRLAGQPAAGDSVEAWARAGRQALLAALAREEGASLLLLAQHRRDQAETVLLQALRAGGPAGLAAMPRTGLRDGLVWARPWLDQPREAIEAYVLSHRLRPLDDPSNADPRFARNRLRLLVWPALTQAFADAEQALVGVAQRAQQASAALAELAALDLAGLVDSDGALQVAGWRRLSPARQANTLRAWWAAQAGAGPAHRLVERLLAEVPDRGAATWPAGAGRVCRLYHGQLRCQSAPLADVAANGAACMLDLSTPGRQAVPGWAGQVEARPCSAGGVALARLRQVRLAERQGGERFQGQPGRPPRSLKLQFQAAGMPAWARSGPLLWSDGQLLFVPGLGVDARAWAPAGAEQCTLHWWPASPQQAAG